MKIVNKLGQVVEVPDSYDPKRIKALGWKLYEEPVPERELDHDPEAEDESTYAEPRIAPTRSTRPSGRRR